MSKNTLPAFITTTENEYDKAMFAQKQFSETHPVEYAVGELLHDYKVNPSYYQSTLDFFRKDPHWEEIKKQIGEKGLPC